MDPKFNEVWSASEIEMVKSLIVSHNANNIYVDDMNKKHNHIVNDLRARFPMKKKRQVIELYVELVAKMLLPEHSGNQSMVANNNFGTPVEDPTMHNVNMFPTHQIDKMLEVNKMVDEAPQKKVIVPQQDMGRNGKFWTIQEHRQFLHGLRMYGRGKWKNISRYFVTTRTPVQISSHAQKYFRRQECTSEKQRYSINDVGLYDAEPWAQNNLSSKEAFSFTGGAYNPNSYGSNSQLASMNNIAQVWSPFYVGQASTNQVSSWTSQQMGASSSAPLALDRAGSQITWNGDQQGDFLRGQWMDTNMWTSN